MKRIESVDVLRGLVMIIMALDHVRDLIHVDSLTQSPTNLDTTTPILFFTRWVTHLCAPTFVFLAGTSAYLSYVNKNDATISRNFLIKRGLWLIVLEITIINFGLFFDLGFHSLLFLVIATIGFGFIVLGFLLNLSTKVIGAIGLLILFAHNLLPLIPFAEGSILKIIVTPFFNQMAIPISGQNILIIGYPPIPWLGIMLIGFASGRVFLDSKSIRKSKFIKAGTLSLVLFVVLRFSNIYGDPALWAPQKNTLFTVLSFINVSKYPPSLLFCLVTLGLMFLTLPFIETVKNKISNVVSVYGKVPLFYYVVHFYLIHIVLIAILFIQGFEWANLNFAMGNYGRPKNIGSGVNLGLVYTIWIGVVITLYKPCLWYGKYKATHDKWWLKYL